MDKYIYSPTLSLQHEIQGLTLNNMCNIYVQTTIARHQIQDYYKDAPAYYTTLKDTPNNSSY